MKKGILLLVLFFAISTIPSIGQSKDFINYVSSLQLYPNGPTSSKLNVRGANWLLDSIICITQIDNSGWVPEENYYYLYDGNNLLVKDSSVEWNKLGPTGAFWKPGLKNLHYYNSQQKEVLSDNLSWYEDDKEWRKDTIRSHNIYLDDKLVTVRRENYRPDLKAWLFMSADSLFYNSSGLLSFKKIYVNLDNEETYIARYFYTYDNDQLKSELLQISGDKGAKWQNYFRNFFHYDNGLLVEKVTEFYDEKMLNYEPTDREVYSYGTDDLLIFKEIYSWDGNNWILYRLCDLYYSQKTTSYLPPVHLKSDTIKMVNPFPGGIVEAPFLEANNEYVISIFNASNQLVFRQKQSGNAWYIPSLNSSGHHLLIVHKKDEIVSVKQFISIR